MCLSIPVRVLSVNGNKAKVSMGGAILEIGSEYGMSASLLRKGSNKTVTILCVDINLDAPYEQNLRERNLWYNIQGFKMSSNEFYSFHTGYYLDAGKSVEQFDLIFIDGDHSKKGAYLDLYESAQILKVGGFILMHDVAVSTNRIPHASHYEVKKAYDEWMSEQERGTFKEIETVDSIVVVQKQ